MRAAPGMLSGSTMTMKCDNGAPGRAALFALLSLCLLQLSRLEAGEDEENGPRIRNPYFETTRWRVWRDDATPLEGVPSMRRAGKEKQVYEATLAPRPAKERIYPVPWPGDDPPEPFLTYRPSPKPSASAAGIWDDVYASWSGLHGYVRNRWKGPGGNGVAVLDHIVHFVDVSKSNTLRAGVNFIHQSTTGMAHTITNGYSQPMTENYEKLYFADALVTAPAHASFTDLTAARSVDLYMALVPTLFNSVGSSNSETMAITKMIAAGGYLPPATKLLLKRNGLYPAAMLYVWKAALPYPVPFDSELRHRVAYKSVGNRETYPERYSSAGIDKGDLSLVFHRYDDVAHMRNMVALARSMAVAPPEAVLKVLEIEGGHTVYTLKKSVLVVQEKDQEIRIRVSTEDCYDLQDRPLTVRWKLLYGNRATLFERSDAACTGACTITIPWDDALPEGRTAIALIANNGAFDSNPAILTVYRKKGDLPPNGASPGGYKHAGTFANRRPVILDLQDQVVRRGQTVRIPIAAVDPEGFGLRFFKRSGEVGELDGNVLSWKCPSKTKNGTYTVSVIASDGTSGNSYAGKRITVHVGKPKVSARIAADRLVGAAPLTVKVSAAGSIGARLAYGWDFYAPAPKRKASAFEKLVQGKSVSHTFEKPGAYEIALTVRGAGGTDTETVGVF
ncbi:MAG: PKD domain-containing protein, partial [Planctomycetota bacterium]